MSIPNDFQSEYTVGWEILQLGKYEVQRHSNPKYVVSKSLPGHTFIHMEKITNCIFPMIYTMIHKHISCPGIITLH